MSNKRKRRTGTLKPFMKRFKPSMTEKKVKKIAQNVIDKQSEFKRRLDYLAETTLTSITSGTVLFDGPQIAVGDGAENRDGLIINLRQLRFKLGFRFRGDPIKVRLIGVRYPQGSESPSLSDLLTHPTAEQCMISPWLKRGPVKYSIWCNKIVSLGGEAAMASTFKEKYVNLAVKLPRSGQKITYESGTTQTPDGNRYTLFAVINILPGVADNRPQVNMFTSTVFTDM